MSKDDLGDASDGSAMDAGAGETAQPARLTPQQKAQRRMKEREKQLRADLPSEPRWSLAHALLWIGFRELSRVAESGALFEDAFKGFYSNLGPTNLCEWIEHLLKQDGYEECKPQEPLIAALRRGAVRATGARNGLDEVDGISSEQWDALDFLDGPQGLVGRDYAIRSDWARGEPLGVYWTALRFDRESLMLAFPERESKPNRGCDPHSEEDIRSAVVELVAAGRYAREVPGVKTVARVLVRRKLGERATKDEIERYSNSWRRLIDPEHIHRAWKSEG